MRTVGHWDTPFYYEYRCVQNIIEVVALYGSELQTSLSMESVNRHISF
jgi:hypothetical protein